MSNKIPTAEELLKEEAKKFSSPLTPEGLQLLVINVANKHAVNHVKAALKAAAKDAEIDLNGCCEEEEFECSATVDKNSILNAYPENLIQ